MPIIQVFYEVPPDLAVGLATGDMTRFGSVVRGSSQIVAHLKEVQAPRKPSEGAVQRLAAAARDPKVMMPVLVVSAATAVVGGGALLVVKHQQRVDALVAALTEYLAAVRKGQLGPDDINRVLAALDDVPRFALRHDAFAPLVREVVLITQKLAEANSYELPEAASDVKSGGSLVQLRSSLNSQLDIMRDAA